MPITGLVITSSGSPACATTVRASTSAAGKRSGVIGQMNGTQAG